MAVMAASKLAALAWALVIGTSCCGLALAAFTRETLRWRHDARCSSASPSPALAPAGQFRVVHKHSACSPLSATAGNSTWLDAVRRAVAYDARRYQYIQAQLETNAAGEVPVRPNKPGVPSDYLIEGELGTPPQKFVGNMDTGSDVVWISCAGCSSCTSAGDPPFDPNASSTAKTVACDDSLCSGDKQEPCGSDGTCQFHVIYGDNTEATGQLIADTLTLGAGTSKKNFVFGCAQVAVSPNVPLTPGIVGLGRQDISLASQTAAQHGHRFSYCLPGYFTNGATGTLTLGGAAPSGSTATAMGTRGSTFYSVGLAGIRVDGELVQTQADTGSTIVDSGTVITRLGNGDYDTFRQAYVQKAQRKGLKLQSGQSDLFSTCFLIPSDGAADVPKVALKFNDGAELALTEEQTLIPDSEDGSVGCLAFLGSSGSISILGNFQQQNMLVAYDVAGATISFSQQNACSS